MRPFTFGLVLVSRWCGLARRRRAEHDRNAIAETVDVVGASADVLLHTTQVATISQELLSALPTARDVRAVMYLAPGVHSSEPFGGFFSVGGAMSLDNLYMVTASRSMNSLENRKEPADLLTFNYRGVLGPSLFVEARYAARQCIRGSGAAPRSRRCP